jgi:hypothetical protein
MKHIRFMLISALAEPITWDGAICTRKLDVTLAWNIQGVPQRNDYVRLPQLPRGQVVLVNRVEWTPSSVTVLGEVWPE